MEVQELGSLTICALRYCFGRMTYMPSLIVDATKANWNLLSKGNKDVIQRDLQEFLTSNRNKGMDCDEKTWLDFEDWILEQNSLEQRKEGLRKISSIIQEVGGYD